MFNSISWQEFLIAIGMIAGGYYVITALLLYNKELSIILNQKRSKQTTLVDDDDQSESNELNLIGTIKTEDEVNVPRENTTDAEELVVQRPSEEEEAIREPVAVSPAILMVGRVTTLLQQIGEIIHSITDENKEDVSILLEHLVENNLDLARSPYGHLIEEFIVISRSSISGVHLESNKIKSLWSEAETTTNSNQ